jgi:hypothetical protein
VSLFFYSRFIRELKFFLLLFLFRKKIKLGKKTKNSFLRSMITDDRVGSWLVSDELLGSVPSSKKRGRRKLLSLP